VRRVERALPDELLARVDEALARSQAEALGVVEAVDEIRGYEAIKLAGVERFRARVAELSATDRDSQPTAAGAS
jgi:indolepyruvate ferredoxin oxidoreductase